MLSSHAVMKLTGILQVFRDAGLRSPVAGSVAMGASNVIGTLLAAGLMDRLGRRPLLLFSHTCMAICLIAMSAAQFSPGTLQRISWKF